jgi:hypothetical protein
MSSPSDLSAKIAQRYSQSGYVLPQAQARAISELRTELERARTKVAELERQLAERNARLLRLPSTYGFDDMESFIVAVIFSADRERLLALGNFETPRGLAAASERPDNKAGNGAAYAPAPASENDGRRSDDTTSTAGEIEAPLPTGTSLDDPSNFGQLPDNALVDAATPDVEQLRPALAFARRVLHTSRVPARVWRAWREFERRAAAVLRNATPGVVSP